MYLRCAISSTPKQWVKWLPLAELWYNSSYYSSLKCSPFKALYGSEPSLVANPEPVLTDNTDLNTTLAERHHFSELLKDHLARAQNRMKMDADSRHSVRSFQVGEQVLLKLQSYVQSLVVSRPCPKLALKYFGPYKIVQKIRTVAYHLELPASAQVHPIFHVSQLKQFTPDHSLVFSELPTAPLLDLAELDSEQILEHRLTKKGSAVVIQVRVKWSSLPASMATWEDFYVLQRWYPQIAAWGQAASQGGGVITDTVKTRDIGPMGHDGTKTSSPGRKVFKGSQCEEQSSEFCYQLMPVCFFPFLPPTLSILLIPPWDCTEHL
jgi:hypothetical protein